MTKSIFSKFLPLLMFCGVLTFMTSCDNDDDDVMTNDPKSIVEIAQETDDFSILVDALIKADLVTTINNGTYTVFAPTNAAFNQFFQDMNASGLDDFSKEELAPILLYHVVGGEVRSTGLSSGYVGTASLGPNDQPIKLKVDVGTDVRLDNDSKVETPDVAATNGVIHIINKVLTPPNVVDIALENDNFSILVQALTRSDLDFDFVGFLSGDGPFTVFAPTNDAFATLLNDNPDWDTLDDIDKATLDAVLKYHVISGNNFESTSLSNGTSVPTAKGDNITINTTNGVTVTDANGGVATVELPDVQGINGVVHVINRVLLP
ncbi:MAG: fasciclin domain-containing protein [Bacteroidota bacterium]